MKKRTNAERQADYRQRLRTRLNIQKLINLIQILKKQTTEAEKLLSKLKGEK